MTPAAGLDARLVVSHREGFELDAALTIEPGRTVALLGPNGAGKSTALGALAGLLPLDAGHIVLAGRRLDDPAGGVFVAPEERRVGVVFQDYLLFPHLTVAENVAFGLRSQGVGRREAEQRTSSWLDRFDLDELGPRRPAELSGGEAQRTALARALIADPDLLLLDEPLSALDVTTRVELRRLLARHLAGFAGPRLLITHDPTEAFLLADEIHILEAGAVTQVGSPDDLRLRPRTPYAADLAGSNLITGTASNGTVAAGAGRLHIADTRLRGPVLATIHPRAISLHTGRPAGSPRNTWEATIRLVEHLGERVRLAVEGPLPLAVEVTPDALRALALGEGSVVWVSIKATEIHVEPA